MGVRTGLKGALAIGLLFLLPAANAVAAPTVTVTNGNDSGPGSLRQAIVDVDPGGKIVIPAGVKGIALSSELLIEKSMTIEGAGSGQTSISAGGASRVLRIAGSPTVTIEGVQIINGQINAPGQERFGGGVDLTGGSLTVADSVVGSNSVLTGTSGFARGGGIAATPGAIALTLRNTTVSDNILEGQGAKGAGVYVDGPQLTIEGGSVKANWLEGKTVIGGGISFHGTRATLAHVSVTGNEMRPIGPNTLLEGIGVALEGSGDSLDGVTVAHNHATMNDGNAEGVHFRGGGAALGGPGTMIVNSTVAANSLVVGAKQSVEAFGGGIWLYGSTSIASSTIAGNTAQASGTSLVTELGADLGVDVGGSATVRDTIIAAGSNVSSATCGVKIAGSIVSQGHDIDSENACGFNATGDRSNVEPRLSALADRGGPVETMSPEAGSPALGGASAECPPTDARGALRPAGDGCDVGAFQTATPIAGTEGASAIGPAAAVLSGVATNPDLAPGTVSFEWGTSTAYGSKSAAQPIAATTRAAGFDVAVGGLAPATTYHYRAVVANALGVAFGADRTFTTRAAAISPGGGPKSGRPTHPKLTVKHLGGLRFKLICAQALCSGRITATGRSGKKRVVVAKAKLRIAPGRSKTLTLKLTKIGKRLQKLPGALPIVVSAKLGGDQPRVPKPLHLRLP